MSTKHFDYLDSLRGFACLVVVFIHYIHFAYSGMEHPKYTGEYYNYHAFFFDTPFSILMAAFPAVPIFFTLSGFVLSYRFIGEKEIRLKIIEAIIKRPIRLAGVILFTLIPVFGFLLTKDFWVNKLWIDYDIYANMLLCLFSKIFSSGAYISNPPLWTINTELWGSFLVFGLCFVLSLNKYYRLLIMIIIGIYFYNTYYILFIFGMIIADFHKNWRVHRFIENKTAIGWLSLVIVIFLGHIIRAYGYNNGMPSISDAMLIFVFIMCNKTMQKVLTFRPLVFIGSISYSIYVIHWLILERYISNGMQSIFSSTLTFCVIALIIIFLSYLIDLFIDKPCIKFSGWFAKNLIKEIQQKIAKVQFKRKPDAVIPEIVTAATDLAEDVQAAELANYPVQEAD